MKNQKKEPKLWQVFAPIAIAGALLYGGWRYAVNQSVKIPKGLETKVVQEENEITSNIYETTENKNQDIDYEKLYRMITRHEGVKDTVYFDSKGIKTIGVGFNLERKDAKNKINSLGLNYNDVCSGKEKLSSEEICILMKCDVETAISDAKKYLGKSWDKLNPKAKEVVIDMAYNLGATNLNKFKGLKEALKKQDYQAAADEMVNSKWYYQTGLRAKEDVNIMRSINPYK